MKVVVTGGAGFIGSALVWQLNRRGIEDILIVDRDDRPSKRRNLEPLRYRGEMGAEGFLTALEAGELAKPDLILHMGAESSTTCTDEAWLQKTNVEYSQRLGEWCIEHDVRFVYASSAATYGDGRHGFSDDPELFDKLVPLNAYGRSKLEFDRLARDQGWLDRVVGLRFFNVYGPNEYHKDHMRSVVPVFTEQILNTGAARLFKSLDPEIPDGGQRRDFIYIADVVEMTLWLADTLDATGVFNIGTGEARTFSALAEAIFKALDRPVKIDWIETPAELRDKYQNYTCADLDRLIAAGWQPRQRSFDAAVAEYVTYIRGGNRTLTPERPLTEPIQM